MAVVINALKNRHARTFRKVAKAFGAEPSFEDYILGAADGRFNPPEDGNLWIVRRDENAPEEYLPWLGLSPFPVEAGKGLIIGWFDGQRGIYAPSVKQMVAAGLNPNTGNTGDTRLHGWWSKAGYPGLICKPIGTLNTLSTLILVEDHEWVDEEHTFRIFKRQQADLASYIPGAGLQRLVLVVILWDGTIGIVSGTTRSTGIPLFPTHIQALLSVKPARSIPVAIFKLANGQTSITDADRIKDMRELLNVQIPPRNNLGATTNPAVTDDEDSGYGLNSVWINTSTPEAFICLDPSTGAAVWESLTASAAGGSDRLKETVRLATAAALPACTYANGTAGVGATLTANANGALTVDGTAVSSSDRVLVKNQASALQNGIYTVTATGDGSNPFVLTRADDSDTSDELLNSLVYARAGTANANFGFFVTNIAAVTIGTDAVNYALAGGEAVEILGNPNPITGTVTLPAGRELFYSGQAVVITGTFIVYGAGKGA